ncbi:apolipoprotein N-acyltransferase [Salinisphaera aquimarina]|uniref:Apolipoprotein N-acyltransferase n=1 Tax=Salinisphaera aquimarina TaxID=2094031 RepID=A0ABV7EV56_9GAMM
MAHCSALLAGAALPLAFAPVDWYWLAVLSPAVLFALVSRLRERDALWVAYLFGVGYFGTGVSWVYISIDRYGSGPVAAAAVTLVFIALLAVFPWSAIYLVRKLRPQMDGVALWLGLPAAWVLTEWVRLWFLTGFPWLFLGYSQVSTPLAALAPVFGVLGVSLVLTIIAGGLAWFCLRPNICRAALTVGAIAAVWAGVALLDREWTYPTSKPLSVALIQGNMAQDNKWKPETLPSTLKRYRNLTQPYLGTDLIVWPETALPIWYDQADVYLGRIKSQLGKHGSTLILGIPVRTEQGDAYNSAVRLGDPAAFYYKRHLVPFGEYIPLRNALGPVLNLLGAPVTDFTEGKRPRLLDVGDVPVGALICFDVAFGGEVADLLPDARLLVNITNDAWFGDSLGPQQHLQIAQMRAIETGRPLLRAANTGITAVVDHNGRLLARAAQFEVNSISAEVTPRRGMTPYGRWRDYPVLAMIALTALALGLLRVTRTR